MNVQVCFCLVVMHCCNAVYSVSSSKQLSKIFQYPLFVHVTEWFRQCNNKSQQMVNVNVPTVFLRHAQLDSALLLLTDGWRRIRPKKKKLPEIHKCISGSFFLFSLAWLVAYSNSIVPGGLLVKSYITLLTPRTSFMILLITFVNTS